MEKLNAARKDGSFNKCSPPVLIRNVIIRIELKNIKNENIKKYGDRNFVVSFLLPIK